MYEILPNQLWIGNARDARDIAAVCAREIAAIVDLAIEEPPIIAPREIAYFRVPLLDGEGNSPALIDMAITTVAGCVEGKLPTLVACSGGMSRSPAVVAAAVTRIDGGSIDAALSRVAKLGPCDVAPGLWRDVCELGNC